MIIFYQILLSPLGSSEGMAIALESCLETLDNWRGRKKPWGGKVVDPNEIQEKVLQIGIPNGAMTPEQAAVFEKIGQSVIGARSWADLERKTVYFSIMVYPSGVHVESWGRAPDGTWGDDSDTALDVRIPAGKGPEAIADVILEHLKTRTDLPGIQL